MTTRATRGPRRRTVVALAVVLAVLGAFVFRLVDIQIVHADDHIADSMDWGLGPSQAIAGKRGSIVDEKGTVLASSALVYDAQLDPMLIMQLEEPKYEKDRPMSWAEASEKIAAITGQSTDEVRQIVAEAHAENEHSRYAKLKNGLSTDQYLALDKLDLPYLAMTSRSVRVYPNGAVAGNIIGFVDGEGKGRAGIEELDGTCLAAKNGKRSWLSGKNGVIVPGSERVTPASDGGTVKLTIDADLNWYLQQMLAEEVAHMGAKNGTITVIEAKTGKIRAAAEVPSLDPIDLNCVPSYTAQLFSRTYEPGSTFKPITAATLLDQKAATPGSVVSAADREFFPDAEINDAFSHPTYQYTLAGALIDSSNVALSKFGTMVSVETRYEYLRKFGVGTPTAVDFPGEESGGVRDPGDKPWDAQTVYATTFGQAFTVTPAQVVSAYQTLANGGKRIDLSLVESCTDADGVEHAVKPKTEQVVSESTAAQVRRMLENVAVQGSLADQVKVPGYRVGIKTGTAEVPNGNGDYKDGVYFTSIVGVAPIEDPQYIVMVTMDEPTRLTMSNATAPALQKALTQVLKTYRVAPSTQPMDALLPKFAE
ncbi:MAG: penicillin-binding protein 2 [Microbacterium sp.]